MGGTGTMSVCASYYAPAALPRASLREKEGREVKFVFISDTHGMHGNMKFPVPGGDVLVHCGDMTGHGTREETERLAQWMGAFPHHYKFAIAGNHDRYCEVAPDAARDTFTQAGVAYLCEDAVTVEGIKLYGAPFTPNFCDWHFMPPRLSDMLRLKWERIPDDTQVLVTHGPPHGILDCYREQRYIERAGQEHVGCELLRNRVEHLRALRVHAFGHIHEGHGREDIWLDNGLTVAFVNAAICTRAYKPTNPPLVVDL